ncbi:hypothetical protein EZ428_08055 [Pedobacter frigiditerrae]|uniref:NACHT domain-containing protein n=1 Tax=Pedobacter frigiditerrae TaxID=2530452 RepID=A0A4R0MZQ5_9SPHI|nr:hypothetical protein [Pedobacter frigiditerrae]TCC91702.1 hypothetical protein EZ428_08055 [Pedobacter frigiditerrae]
MTHLILNELRHLILQKLKIQIISPSDCSYIALEINKSLHKNISVTTVKRLFGFAVTQHQFSTYTINTLLAFVESEQDNPISKTALKTTTLTKVEEWDYLVIKSKSYSEATKKRIVDNCSIPYQFTINRKFATHDFDYFYHSNFSFTPFISQGGYGKSILLSHLVENLFLKPEAKFNKDVILFLHADKIFDLEQEKQDLTKDIAVLLGLPPRTNLIKYFTEQHSQTGRKLVLIFDGVTDILNKHGLKPKLFDTLVQLICDVEDSPAIKLVISVRSYTWRRFFESIRHSSFIISKWFTGSYFKRKDHSNIPPFTIGEIEQILDKMDANSASFNTEYTQKLRHPFQFYFYHQLKLEYPENEYSSSLIFHEVTLRYLLLRIYQSNHSIEKTTICKKIIHLTDYGRKGNKISKKLLLEELIVFRDAYMELLHDGILIEQVNDTDEIPTEYIHFIHNDVFEYFLFKEILELHKHEMNEAYFNFILNEYKDQDKQNILLQWYVFEGIKNNKFEIIKTIFWLKLDSNQHNQLITFLAENIKHQISIDPSVKDKLRCPELHNEMANALPYLDFADQSYQKILNTFSEIADTEKTFVFYQSALIFSDCLNLNLEKLRERKTQLSKHKSITSKILVDPSEIVEIMIDKFNGREEIQYPLFARVNDIVLDLKFNENPNNLMSGLLLIMVYWFKGDSQTAIEIINNMIKGTKELFQKSKIYNAYLLHILALETSRSSISNKKPDQLEKILIYYHQRNQINSFNVKILFNTVLAMQSLRRNEYDTAINYAKNSLTQVNDDFLIAKVFINYILIKAYSIIGDQDKINECKYSILCLLEAKEINPHLFDETLVQTLNKY